MSLKTNVYMGISVILLVNIVALLFNFLGVKFSSYGNYLVWFVALVIFYFVLPKKSGLFFVKKVIDAKK